MIYSTFSPINSGKDRFRDLKEGKVTLPHILLLKNQSADVLRKFSSGDKERLLELFRRNRIVDQSLNSIRRYRLETDRFLGGFNDSLYKTSIRHLIDFIGRRDY